MGNTTMGGSSAKTFSKPVVMGTEDIMSPKVHGTSDIPVQSDLRWNGDVKTADKICNFNRHYAEHSGYFQTTAFLQRRKATSPSTSTTPTLGSCCSIGGR